MSMKHLTTSAVRARRVRRSHDQSHAANSGHGEVEALAGAKPRRADDLNLGQLPRPAADAVDRLGAEVNAAPEFTDPEFRFVRDQANLSTVGSPADLIATTDGNDRAGAGSAGVPPLTPEQLRSPFRAAVGALRNDARDVLAWLLRGHVATSTLFPLVVRRTLLRIGGVKLGGLVQGLKRCHFESPNVSIGTGSAFNAECWFEGSGRIEIGENCMFGPQVLVLTSTHAVGRDGAVDRQFEALDVHIEDGCWICARATILGGVRIGAGAIVAAGAVVTSDCEPGGFYAGVPARRVR